jgi:hypothetical protein
MPARPDLDHALQLRLSKITVGEIDEAIAKVPQLGGFSRCKFIRASVLYALDSLEEEGHLRNGRGAVTKENEQ